MLNVRAGASPDGDKYIAYSGVVVCPTWNGSSSRNVDRVSEWIEKPSAMVNISSGRCSLCDIDGVALRYPLLPSRWRLTSSARFAVRDLTNTSDPLDTKRKPRKD